MRKRTRRFTVANTLTVMAILFGAIGFTETRFGIPAWMDWSKIACLVVVHACFSWRLTKAMERVLIERTRNGAKAWAAGSLAAFYFGVDVWLVHVGLGWVFSGWSEPALYAAGIGFTAVTLLGKWVDQPSPRGERAAPRPAPLRLPTLLEVSDETRVVLVKIEDARRRRLVSR